MGPDDVAAWRAWSARAPHEALREFHREPRAVVASSACIACHAVFSFELRHGQFTDVPDFCGRCKDAVNPT